MTVREYNFDGLPGPTHNYAGLSPGNIASTTHAGQRSNPRDAALQCLQKARFVASLGVGQAILPPHVRPDVEALRRLGFSGADAEILEQSARGDGHLLRLCSSASAMWTANAATLAPSCDTLDGRLHITPANLTSMFHRSLEAQQTTRVLRTIFADERFFSVHAPLPGGEHFSDEGAANHTRLVTEQGVRHLLGWGRSAWGEGPPRRFPARQTREASAAIARANRLRSDQILLWPQDPLGIDAGAFHSDVLAVGNEHVLLLHERAFVEGERLIATLHAALGETLRIVYATERELPVRRAVDAYPFNSQLLTLPDASMVIIAPMESQRCDAARTFLERVVAEDNPVRGVHFTDVNASMHNGGGPACLRLRVPLNDAERHALHGRVLWDDQVYGELVAWVTKTYRDRLTIQDLADPQLLNEARTALDGLSQILRLGSIYAFQRDCS